MAYSDKDDPRKRYIEHKWNARHRDIPFKLTFEEWCFIWRESGKWDQRGSDKGQYVMARPGDRGAYELANVIICLAENNRAERNQNYSMKGEKNPAYGKDYWATVSKREQEKRKATISKKLLGKPKGEAMGAKLSATVTGRRAIVRDGQRTWAYPNDADYSSATGWS